MCIIQLILLVASKVDLMLAFYENDFLKILLLPSGEARTGTQVRESLSLFCCITLQALGIISLVNYLGDLSLALLSAARETSSWNRYRSRTLCLGPSRGPPALAFTIWTSFLIFTNPGRATFSTPEAKSSRRIGV